MNELSAPENHSEGTVATHSVRAFLENLTGPSRGRVSWLAENKILALVGPDRILHLKASDLAPPEENVLARLSWDENTYAIEMLGDQNIWVNGRKIGTAHLMHGDMIEFGDDGPMSRFRLCTRSFPTRWPIEDILGDTIAYMRTSRQSFGLRAKRALFEGGRRVLVETTILFRLSVIFALIGLTAVGVLQYRTDQRLQQSIQQEALRLQAITTALVQTRQEALTPSDLSVMREEFDLQLTTNAERLAALERQTDASARVIKASLLSVAFLQGAYGLRHVESGALLRHVLGPQGKPMVTPTGQPMIDPHGNGAPFEIKFTGTGFLLKDGGQLVTNRHVAVPWGSGNKLKAFTEGGLKPEILKLVAFLPDLPEPVDAELARSSETADLALLLLGTPITDGRGLTLAEEEPNAGDEVIVMGFPTGLRTLLVQAGPEFLKNLEDSGESDFWTIAIQLSKRGLIVPLASRGIIGQIAAGAIVYDAETTHGGSGGPVLNRDGHVIAVNAAIIPEYGGSNFGVPVLELKHLLQSGNAN
ncbi:MAG: serine protease [Rhodobacteraceae bacterium]|nr:serine protease [Paracoccaceae bacterium]